MSQLPATSDDDLSAVYLSLGSNQNKQHNICSAIAVLREQFGEVVCSNVYEVPAHGFTGEAFYNLCVGLRTTLDWRSLKTALLAIEADHQRTRSSEKFADRTLDIDILLYGEQVLQPEVDIPRDEITQYNFVLYPLAEIAPHVRHPSFNKSIAQLASASHLSQVDMRVIHPCDEWLK